MISTSEHLKFKKVCLFCVYNIFLCFFLILVGNVTTGNWTCHVQGLYQLGVTSLIAHFKIAGMQIALETKVNVIPKTGKITGLVQF